MPDWKTYKAVVVPHDNPSGAGGAYLSSDLMGLADRAPYVTDDDPTTSDDSSRGFFVGSHWFNNSTDVAKPNRQTMWVCVDPANPAKWRSLYKRIENAIVLAPAAPPTGQGTDARALQLDEDGDDRGNSAIDFQRTRDASSQVASGNYSFIAGGRGNTASADCAHAEGMDNVASGLYGSHVEGRGSTASGYYSHAEGNNAFAYDAGAHAEGLGTMATVGAHAEGLYTIASGKGSHSGGYRSKAHLLGQWARASNCFGGNIGTAQTTISHLFIQTTNATATELSLDGSSPGAVRYSIVAGQTLSCIVNIVGRKVSGAANDHGSFLRQVCIRRTSTTTQLVGSVQTIGTDINPSSWGGVTISADDTHDSLKIEVTGAASTNILWMATVFASEVADAAI